MRPSEKVCDFRTAGSGTPGNGTAGEGFRGQLKVEIEQYEIINILKTLEGLKKKLQPYIKT